MYDERIIELEIKVSYQEDLLQELNKVVSEQQQQIERLELVCKLLNERIKSVTAELTKSTDLELPPHY